MSNHSHSIYIPCNLEAMKRNVGHDQELLDSLVELYLEELPGSFAILTDAIKREHLVDIQREAHTMKAVLGTIMADKGVILAQRIESQGQEGDLDAIHETFSQLEREIELILQFLRTLKP